MRSFPLKVTWCNSGHDKPITLVGVYGEMNGEVYYISESKTGIPASQIIWPETKLDKLKRWLRL